jgi:pimeloyl-ACP methyl ester carboxylesterase
MKSLYWQEPGQLAFRFNLASLIKTRWNRVALSTDPNFEKPTLFIRGGNSNYILDTDFADIKSISSSYFETIPNAGHWLHAENQLFYDLTVSFLK